MPLHPMFRSILEAHGARSDASSRKPTIRAHPDLTGFGGSENAWSAYDENTYDGAPDAGPQIVGWGVSAEAALADYDEELAAFELSETGRIAAKQGRWLITLKRAMREAYSASSLDAAKNIIAEALSKTDH